MGLFERLFLPIGTKPAGGWIKWRHTGIPDELGEEREAARKVATSSKHCEICTALSGGYFPSFNMPQYPQHPHCDCMLFSIPKPTASQAESVCDIRKFTEYIFVPDNSDGKTKCFTGWGYSMEDSEYLKTEYERQALNKYLKGDYALQLLDRHGQRITVTIELKTVNKNV